jgi:hypothetical protein
MTGTPGDAVGIISTFEKREDCEPQILAFTSTKSKQPETSNPARI